MKALTLKEPWLALIAAGKKKIEPRSWKTNYRGPLYLHASASPVNRNDPQTAELLRLIPEEPLRCGLVACRCVLTDCRVMDGPFLEQMELEPVERLCGIYAPGRYAWFLEDIEVLPQPFPAKGMLGLWNWEGPSL